MWGWARRTALCVVVLALMGAASTPARAEVRLEGDEANLRVTAETATLGEVLAVLKAKFRLRYGSISVDRQISGTLSGSLHRVVVQLLDGFDSVVSRTADGVEIIQLAPRGMANAVPQARRGVTLWQTPPPQAMAQPPR